MKSAILPLKSLTRHRFWMAMSLALWVAGVAGGVAYLFQYEFTSAARGDVHQRWPTGTLCRLTAKQPTLVMFVHPRCPCSRASINELAKLMSQCQHQVHTDVVFFQPRSASADWVQTDLWRSAASISGVTCSADVDGVEQRRFGARTSGEVFLYEPSGKLLFHGGITASRGHAGDNAGRDALENILLRHQRHSAKTPIYGCELQAKCDLPNSDQAIVKTRQVP